MIHDIHMRREFIAAMGASDYCDALVAAMNLTNPRGPHDKIHIPEYFFGSVITEQGEGGVFYADGDPENARWYPDTTLAEARALLSTELGIDLYESESYLAGIA